MWTIAGGDGQFEGASGRITSTFFVSDTGDLTENQLGVVFVSSTPQRSIRDVPGAIGAPSARPSTDGPIMRALNKEER